MYCGKCGDLLIDGGCPRCESVMGMVKEKIREAVREHGKPSGDAGGKRMRLRGVRIDIDEVSW